MSCCNLSRQDYEAFPLFVDCNGVSFDDVIVELGGHLAVSVKCFHLSAFLHGIYVKVVFKNEIRASAYIYNVIPVKDSIKLAFPVNLKLVNHLKVLQIDKIKSACPPKHIPNQH